MLSAARVLQLFPRQAFAEVLPRIYPREALGALGQTEALKQVNEWGWSAAIAPLLPRDENDAPPSPRVRPSPCRPSPCTH